jgi:hypothetical protein
MRHLLAALAVILVFAGAPASALAEAATVEQFVDLTDVGFNRCTGETLDVTFSAVSVTRATDDQPYWMVRAVYHGTAVSRETGTEYQFSASMMDPGPNGTGVFAVHYVSSDASQDFMWHSIWTGKEFIIRGEECIIL